MSFIRRLSFLLCLAAALAAPARAEFVTGRVLAVLDGDTVLFRPDDARPFKLRLAAIDAPETDQPHGAAAKRALEILALGRPARVELRATDRYGRRVGALAIADREAAAELVLRGHAWASRWYADQGLVALERLARDDRRGLWAAAEPVPPWRWRAARKQKHISE